MNLGHVDINDNSDAWYGKTDIHIKMPSIKTYKIWAKIVKIKRGEPFMEKKTGIVNNHTTSCMCDLCHTKKWNNAGFYPSMQIMLYQYSIQPYKCPVCEGRGLVPQGFYNLHLTGISGSTAPETCKTCNGQGILWG